MWIARLFPCYRPNTCIISNGFAAMGIGVPDALAAKLVHQRQHVVAVTGDGGFLTNSQELETAVREEVLIVRLMAIAISAALFSAPIAVLPRGT